MGEDRAARMVREELARIEREKAQERAAKERDAKRQEDIDRGKRNN